jgi:hypothetical protein
MVLGSSPNVSMSDPQEPHFGIEDDRTYWVEMLSKIADPLLSALAANRLKELMPVEARSPNLVGPRGAFTHLEGFGRLLCGMAPWLQLPPDSSSEGLMRGRFSALAKRGLENAVRPGGKDRMNFSEGAQPLVDAAFLALALMRAPRLWVDLTAESKAHLIAALKETRAIKPSFTNWLLFSTMIEAFFLSIGEQYDPMRIDYGLRQHEQWYKGDGMFGDGPEFHWDNYNSYVIQPFLRVILSVVAKKDRNYSGLFEKFNKIGPRYAVIQERLIGEDGSFPPIGRSLAYRCGAFHHLASEASLRLLPKDLKPAQVRGALTAVIRKTLSHPSNFDAHGWLTLGLSGHQPHIAEEYISTGSLYLCTTAFLPLGLPPHDEFWLSPSVAWTARRVWNGEDVEPDVALKVQPE